MSRLLTSTLALGLLWLSVPAGAQGQNVVTHESTTTAKVDRIERSTRVVTLHGEGNAIQSVYVDPAVKAFDELKVGDVVTVRYVESVVVRVRRDAKLSDVRDSTEEARKAGNRDVIEQLKAVVTVEDVDPQGHSITYRTKDGQKMMRVVDDKKLVEGLHPGDRIEVTRTRERAISIERR
jgi:hypothetical protein